MTRGTRTNLLQGYVRNTNQAPGFDIPTEEGVAIRARWVRPHRADYTKVEGLTGKELPGEGPYVTDIYASSTRLPNEPSTPLPIWFLQILQGRTAAFDTLQQASFRLDDYGIPADLSRYRNLYNELRHTLLDIDRLQAEQELIREHMDQARCRLESCNIAKRLSRYQALVPPGERLSTAVASSAGNTPPRGVRPLHPTSNRGRFAV